MKSKWIGLLLLVFGFTACMPQVLETPTPSISKTEESDLKTTTQVTTEAFELYLLADGQLTGADAYAESLEDLTLAETPLLNTADITSYVKDTHTLALTSEAFLKVVTLFADTIQVSGIPFVVVSNGERIYAGAFWTPLSSLSFDGVVIMDPSFQSENNMIQLTLGYPSIDFFTGTDPCGDDRLIQALDDAGVLE